jgi:DNA-3-methyladenine glycosylase
VVTDRVGFPAAVLIRAIQPQEGIEYMCQNRGFPPERQLTNGPEKLAQALALDRSLNGLDLCQSDLLFIEEATRVDPGEIEVTPRIGIRADEIAKRRPWRFLLGGKL